MSTPSDQFNPFPNPFDAAPTIDLSASQLNPITVTAQRLTYNPTSSVINAGFVDPLSPIIVTARKIPVTNLPIIAGMSLGDWLRPPKVFLTLGLSAAVLYVLARRRKRSRLQR